MLALLYVDISAITTYHLIYCLVLKCFVVGLVFKISINESICLLDWRFMFVWMTLFIQKRYCVPKEIATTIDYSDKEQSILFVTSNIQGYF